MKNKSLALWKKANLVIPTGNSFLSKNKSRHPSKSWPIYFDKSKGVKSGITGKKYYDFSFMGGAQIFLDTQIQKLIINYSRY